VSAEDYEELRKKYEDATQDVEYTNKQI